MKEKAKQDSRVEGEGSSSGTKAYRITPVRAQAPAFQTV